MTVKAAYATPLLRVADVERSLQFYSLLGFEIVDIERANGSVEWARVRGEATLRDPDGYVILINQWGKQEHDTWELERNRRLAST